MVDHYRYEVRDGEDPLSGRHHQPRERSPRSGVGTILVGTVSGQALVILASPILTRFYTPTDFGLMAVFTSLTAVFGVASVMRLDAAITLPRTEGSAAAVAWVALTISSGVALIVCGLGPAIGPALGRALRAPNLYHYWWLIALATYAFALDQILLTWMVRERRYQGIALRNFSQGAGQVVAQGLLAAANVRRSGLLIGLLIGRIAAIGGLFSSGGLVKQRRPRPRLMRAAFTRYRRFVYVSSWSALINSLGLQVPLLVISAYYGQATVGLLGLTFRVMAAPAGLIGLAVSKVFQGEASAAIRTRSHGLRRMILHNARTLVLVGLPIAVIVVIAGPAAFGIVFGPEWREAGVYARYLALGYLAQLVVTPVSLTLVMLERQTMQLVWDSTRMALTITAPLICAAHGASAAFAVLVLGVTYIVCYTLLFFTCLRAAARYDREVGSFSSVKASSTNLRTDRKG